MKSFNSFSAIVKHNLSMSVYQLISKDCSWLNISTPTAFEKPIANSKLPKSIAYYIAHAMKNRALFLKHINLGKVYVVNILLWLLADDSIKLSNKTETKEINLYTYRAEKKASIEEQFEYYNKLDFGVASLAAENIRTELERFSSLFEGYGEYRFITPEGIKKLKEDWKTIWDEFDLDSLYSGYLKVK